MTKMQASEIEQLDNKSFNRWCEVSLLKVYSFFCFDLFAGFFCKCSARNHVFDPYSSIFFSKSNDEIEPHS